MARSKCTLEGAIIIPTQSIADAFGWTKTRTKRWLIAHGIFRKEPTGPRGLTYTTTALLQQAFPETAALIMARISSSDRKPESWLRAI